MCVLGSSLVLFSSRCWSGRELVIREVDEGFLMSEGLRRLSVALAEPIIGTC